MSILFIIQSIFGFFSVILYITVYYHMSREKKHFQPYFFKIWITMTILNLLAFFQNYFCFRIPQQQDLESPLSDFLLNFPWPLLLKFLHVFGFYLFYCQNLSILIITINRVKAIAMPFSGTPIWETHFILTLGFILLFPLPFCIGMFGLPQVRYKYNTTMEGFHLSVGDAKIKDYILYLIIFECCVTLTCLLLNSTSLVLLSRRSKLSNYRRDRNMFIVCFASFCIQTLNTVVAVTFYVFERDHYFVIIALYSLPFMNDLFCLGMPYIIIFFNPKIRSKVSAMIPCISTNNNSNNEKSSSAVAV